MTSFSHEENPTTPELGINMPEQITDYAIDHVENGLLDIPTTTSFETQPFIGSANELSPDRPAPEDNLDTVHAVEPDIESGDLSSKEIDSNTSTTVDEVVQNDNGFLSRLKDTVSTLFLKELPERGHRIRRIGALALGGATQGLERARTMVIFLPKVFDKTLVYSAEHGYNGYQTALLGGVAVGGLFGLWEYAVGKTFKKSIDNFPATTDKVLENHPTMVGVVGKAISGFPNEQQLSEKQPAELEGGYEVSPYETRKTKLGKVALGITRGLSSAFLYGTTPHVGIGKVSKHSDKSIEKRLRAVTIESAAALGGVAMAVSAMITHNFFGAAEKVKDVITNDKILISASAVLVLWGILGNRASRTSFRKKQGESTETDGQPILLINEEGPALG